ncbi:hypothetical protein BU24DRAFT_166892 [Aaosphaeria arxii CBS 175.79]|uniref:C2H2-type domain-containing protein n=1 Tax=Aaosphaeria arxii CBS 175.79 TaxID=1450172 RepID=A0A6A5XZP3_9PLEO|nr:uncharacterized protein BU24DRAFT_166892 [Aaosphaeria arxii CBS 175.79]KAF2018191.1 hypothetical protein BU24DRAFT_166892 [Aaosphaeria arxii CBS 175.79]
MLAFPQRRQHNPLPHHHHHQYNNHYNNQNPTTTLPSPPTPTTTLSSTATSQLSYDTISQQLQQPLSAQQLYDQQLLHDYLESQQQQSFVTGNFVDADSNNSSNPFMTGEFTFSSPSIRVQQSTPTPQQLSTSFAQTSIMPGATAGLDNWNAYQNSSQSLQTPRSVKYHPVQPAANYQTFSNHLPTPTHTPTQDSFINSNSNSNSNFTNFAPNTTGMDSAMAVHLSMKQALMDQNNPDEDVPGFGHSARHSVSSYGHDSPATPHTAQGEDFDDRYKMPTTDMRQHTVPKFERTYTDAAIDNFYDPTTMMSHAQSLPQTKQPSLLSPYRGANHNDIVQKTLAAAQIARSQSPSSSASRGVSPFRQNSPFRQTSNSFNSPRMRVGTAAEAREQKVEADAAYAMKSNVASNTDPEPKTISPKDAMLDYREPDEEAKVPLFPEGGATEYDQYNRANQFGTATQSGFDTTTGQSFQQQENWAAPQFPSSNFSTTSAATSQPSFAYVPTTMSNSLQGLPFTSAPAQYRSTTSMPAVTESTPDFPAHLTSMESSASEAGPEPSSQSSEHQQFLHKPGPSAADSGTYTCTYHGCTLRFETPQKLQKHKREGHRSTNTASTIGSSMTSAALLERNSQAGPHKCERINPTTGKPCNTIFSRPYDLTRHEDTIHNARKQKVRCALCVEEKTFSRNDALTRHMVRVHRQSPRHKKQQRC